MRTVLVTGGAKRLGAAIVRRLAEDGHAVVVHQGHSLDEAGALVAEIVAGGGHAAAVSGDLSDLGAIGDLFAAARTAIGGSIDGLVNCASRFEFDRPPSVDPVLFAELGAINCGAPVLLAVSLDPHSRPPLLCCLLVCPTCPEQCVACNRYSIDIY